MIYLPCNLSNLLQHCRVGRSWHAEHVCSFNLPSVSYSFWNKGRKVLKFWKFVKIYPPCNVEVNLITHLGVIALFSSIFFFILILFVLYFKNYLEIDVKFIAKMFSISRSTYPAILVKIGKSSKFIKNPVIYVKKFIIMLKQFKFGHFLA
jgi:hypothetical protein